MSNDPQLVMLDPGNLQEELRGPVLTGLLGKGYTIGPAVVLEDPRKPEGNRHRIGLIMAPPPPATLPDTPKIEPGAPTAAATAQAPPWPLVLVLAALLVVVAFVGGLWL